MVLCPLLIVNFRGLGIIWSRLNYSFVFTYYPTWRYSTMTRRTTSELPDIGTKLEAWRSKMFHNFHFLQSDMIFLSLNIWYPFQWEKLPDCYAFLLTYIEFGIEKFFPPAEFWLVNSNFRHGSQMQGIYWSKLNYRPLYTVKDHIFELRRKIWRYDWSSHYISSPQLKVHITPKFFFGRDETLQHSHK